MPFTLVQAGKNLQSINTSGVWSANLALPVGVSLATNRVPRFARFNDYIVLVNTPSKPLSIGSDGTVRPLTPAPPGVAVALTSPDSGGLTGTYLARQTYRIYDSLGNIIAESDYSPLMASAVIITSKKLLATFVVSPETTVTATQLYRTTNNGGTYFPWVQVPGNTATTAENDLSDSALGIVAGATLGTAPDLTLICSWGGRMWGVSRTDVDHLRFTEAGTMYAWGAQDILPIAPIGDDAAGITALIPRRNYLGVARTNYWSIIAGTSSTNYTQTQYGKELGCLSQESVVVYKDTAFFLWRDGVYTWDNNGFQSITDGAVRSWFTTGDTFNRSMFWRAFAQLDPVTLKYRLFLASAGSVVIDRWIEYDLLTGKWWGPHKTAAFNPTSAVLVAGADMKPYYMVGSQNGYLSKEQTAKDDWGFGIDLKVATKRHHLGQPDYEKYFGEVSVLTTPQNAGVLSTTATVGPLKNPTTKSLGNVNLTQGRSRIGRVGQGQYASLTFENAVADQDVELLGYEINPVNIVGRR